eukprot:3078671-Rhodomonas_salina.1
MQNDTGRTGSRWMQQVLGRATATADLWGITTALPDTVLLTWSEGDFGTELLDLAMLVDPAVAGHRRYQWSTTSAGPDRGWLQPVGIELTFSTLSALPSFLVLWTEAQRPGQRALIRDQQPRV